MKKLFTRFQGLALDKSRNYFLVTSHGQTASMWLAGILNKIPGVYCTHGYTYPPMQAKLEEITHHDIYHRERSSKRFERLPLKQYFREISQATDAPIVGNVLSFYLGRLLDRSSRWQLNNKSLKIINVIRHPITRINSTLKTWDPHGEGALPPFVPVDFLNHCTHIIEYVTKHYKVDVNSSKAKSFIVALLAMQHIARDVRMAKKISVSNVKYEDLTRDINVFSDVLSHLTGLYSTESKQQINDIFHCDKINAHNKGASDDPEIQYEQWEPWQQAAYSYVSRLSDISSTYAEFQYKFLVP